MELIVHGKHLDVGDALRTHMKDKMEDINEKYFNFDFKESHSGNSRNHCGNHLEEEDCINDELCDWSFFEGCTNPNESLPSCVDECAGYDEIISCMQGEECQIDYDGFCTYFSGWDDGDCLSECSESTLSGMLGTIIDGCTECLVDNDCALFLDTLGGDIPCDSDDFDPYVCIDSDEDGCNDCLYGVYNPANDGPDSDGDHMCDAGDPEPDYRHSTRPSPRRRG